MAKTASRRLTLAEIDADRNVVIAVQALSDYAPADRTHTPARLKELWETMDQTRQSEIHAQNALAAARDAAGAAEQAAHQAVLRAKAQVIAQYGHDSDAVQSIGLKKKSDRKRPTRRPAKTTA